MLSFTILIMAKDPYFFGIMSLVIRFTEGFGNGCINASCNSIIQFNFEDRMSKYIALIQTSTGLGMLAGPVVGSFFYDLGGFRLPFSITGGLLSFFGLCVMALLTNDKKKTQDTYENADKLSDLRNSSVLSSSQKIIGFF